MNIRNSILDTVAADGRWEALPLASGFPVNPFAGVNRANTNIGNDRPDATAKAKAWIIRLLSDGSTTGAFVLQPIYQFGNAGRNTILGPAGFSLDFALHKDFRIPKERSSVGIPRRSIQLPESPGVGFAERNSLERQLRAHYFDQREHAQMQLALKYLF